MLSRIGVEVCYSMVNQLHVASHLFRNESQRKRLQVLGKVGLLWPWSVQPPSTGISNLTGPSKEFVSTLMAPFLWDKATDDCDLPKVPANNATVLKLLKYLAPFVCLLLSLLLPLPNPNCVCANCLYRSHFFFKLKQIGMVFWATNTGAILLVLAYRLCTCFILNVDVYIFAGPPAFALCTVHSLVPWLSPNPFYFPGFAVVCCLLFTVAEVQFSFGQAMCVCA